MKANVYPVFKKEINVAYPPGNKPIFEEWFDTVYEGCKTDRVYLPIFWTSYFVNNNYGNDQESITRLHFFLSELDKTKKYFTIVQYDNGTMIDWDILGLDVLEFNMSKNGKNRVGLPLLCQPHPYQFDLQKRWFISFVGSKTHPIREKINIPQPNYISFEYLPIDQYCKILNESTFSLCPRGYGINSFRIAESVQYGAIPVYISDEFILPHWMNFEDFGVIIPEKDIYNIHNILASTPNEEVMLKQKNLSEAYENFYTYETNLKHIIKYLDNENIQTHNY